MNAGCDIYNENKKMHIYFCYKKLFSIVINNVFKKINIEYQGNNFLHTPIFACYFACYNLLRSCYTLLIGKFNFITKIII